MGKSRYYFVGGHRRVFSKERVLYVGQHNGNISFLAGNGVSWVDWWDAGQFGTISVGRWYHIVWVKDGTSYRAYRDGVLSGTPQTGTLATLGDNTMIEVLGIHNPIQLWKGLIDEVRIFRAAMPVSYIQKRYVYGLKHLASQASITQQEKEERLTKLRNSPDLVICLDSTLSGPIDFSVYEKYLNLEVSEVTQ